jgi:hypothetical protein
LQTSTETSTAESDLTHTRPKHRVWVGPNNKPQPQQEKIMNIVLTLLPLGIVAAQYLVADIRDRRRNPEAETICG